MGEWNKGRFGFWIVGKNYMRKRDAIMARLMETQGAKKERDRIVDLLRTIHYGSLKEKGDRLIALIKEGTE